MPTVPAGTWVRPVPRLGSNIFVSMSATGWSTFTRIALRVGSGASSKVRRARVNRKWERSVTQMRPYPSHAARGCCRTRLTWRYGPRPIHCTTPCADRPADAPYAPKVSRHVLPNRARSTGTSQPFSDSTCNARWICRGVNCFLLSFHPWMCSTIPADPRHALNQRQSSEPWPEAPDRTVTQIRQQDRKPVPSGLCGRLAFEKCLSLSKNSRNKL